MSTIHKKITYKSNILKLALLLSFSISAIISAQNNKTSTLAFLLINTDARSGGIANNGVSTTAGPNSIYHNPAKMIHNESDKSISINYTPWLASITKDISISSGNYIHKIDKESSFGLDLKYFSLGQIELKDVSGKSEGTTNPNELALNCVYARKLSKGFSMGVGIKYVHSNLNSSTNSNAKINTVNANISGFYQSEKLKFNNFDGIYHIGMNLSNLGPKVSYFEDHKNFVPTNLKSGASFDFILGLRHKISTSLEFSNLLVPTDANSNNSSLGGIIEALQDTSLKDFTVGFGTEYLFNNKFSFRGGFFNESKFRGSRKFATFGGGIIMNNLILDISYLANTSDFNSANKNTARISLALQF